MTLDDTPGPAQDSQIVPARHTTRAPAANTRTAPPVGRVANLDYRLSAYTVHWVVDGVLTLVVDGDAVAIPAGHYFVSSPRQRVFENPREASRARTVTLTIPERVMRAAYFELKHSSQRFFRHSPQLGSWPLDFAGTAQAQEKYLGDILVDITGPTHHNAADRHVPQSRHFELLAERLLLKENSTAAAGRSAGRLKQPPRSGQEWEATVRAYIEKHYARPLTLKQMAEAMFLSPHHFLRRFKAAFGLTPYQYLIAKRLTVARSLLANTALRVEDISTRVGYPSVNGFYRAFQRRYGRSPSTFRGRRQA